MNHTVRLPSLPPWAHWDREKLVAEKERNPRAFARGFQMRAFSDDERMFPSFGTCYENGVVVGDVIRRRWATFAGVDLASDKRPGNVIFVAALDPQTMRRYPVEILIGAWKSPEVAKKLGEVNARHDLRFIMVENNGYQQALVDWISHSPGDHSFWYKVEPFTTTGKTKRDAEIGMPSLEVEFKNRAWVVPATEFGGHPATCRCGWCTWVGEVRDYPMSATTDCLVPGSMITTPGGPVAIESVVPGETMVLTHERRWQPVSAIAARQERREIYRVKSAGALPLHVTGRHPVLVCRGVLRYPATTAHGTQTFREKYDLDGMAFVKAEELADLPEPVALVTPFDVTEEVPEPFDLASLAKRAKRRGVGWKIGASTMSQRDVVRPRFLRVDEELGLLLGLYLAEGSTSDHAVHFALNADEGYIADWIEVQMHVMFGGGSASRVFDGGGMVVICQGTLAKRFFARFGKSTEKGLTTECMRWPRGVQRAILRGWLIGDASLYLGRLRGVSISRKLLWQMETIANRLGVTGRLSEFLPPRETVIDGRRCQTRRSWCLGFASTAAASIVDMGHKLDSKRWAGFITKTANNIGVQIFRERGLLLRKLRSVERLPYDGPVYDMEIEGDRSYVAEGVAVHNCVMAMHFCREAMVRWGGAGVRGVGVGDLNLR